MKITKFFILILVLIPLINQVIAHETKCTCICGEETIEKQLTEEQQEIYTRLLIIAISIAIIVIIIMVVLLFKIKRKEEE